MTSPTFPNVLVVGMHFRGAQAVATVSSFLPPVELELEREPQNPYDEFAIKVNYQGEHIGYIERGQAAFISPQIDAGQYYTCTVEELTQKGRNIHPSCTIAPGERPGEMDPDFDEVFDEDEEPEYLVEPEDEGAPEAPDLDA